MKKILSYALILNMLTVVGFGLLLPYIVIADTAVPTAAANNTSNGSNAVSATTQNGSNAVSATGKAGLQNPLKWNDFNLAFSGFMAQIKIVAGIVAVLAFIWVGWLYVKAMGDPKKIEVAHKAFMYVAIGVAILLGAEILTSIIQNTIGKL
jgi:Type IV secretion system pilin